MAQKDLIDPRQLIEELSPEELCEASEAYFAAINYPFGHMAKPFSSLLETPELLHKMGVLLSGLRLGRSMTVLDFGAGTCWFSRYLNQLGCATISVDPSETALELGRRLFREHPIIGEMMAEPRFSRFDGYRIDLPDASVDRIVCYDVFHHVPNQGVVLAEFHRVLKDGGVIGFSEPGPHHSESAVSQYEMRTYTVLENDIRLGEIAAEAARVGFSELRIKPTSPTDLEIDLEAYETILAHKSRSMVEKVLRRFGGFRKENHPTDRLLNRTVSALESSSVFFFTKGTYVLDSRGSDGLAAEVRIADATSSVVLAAGELLSFRVRTENTGSAVWLRDNFVPVGVVNCGVHLMDTDNNMLELDFARGRIANDIKPGEHEFIDFELETPGPGQYRLSIDMVSEGVCWFEILGTEAALLDLTVA